MALVKNEATQDAIEALSDDETIREWVHAVREMSVMKDLPDKTRDWVEGMDDMNNLQADEIQWAIVVDFLLDNIT